MELILQRFLVAAFNPLNGVCEPQLSPLLALTLLPSTPVVV
jgi:hypothetical protein